MSFTPALIYNCSALHMIFAVHIQLLGHITIMSTQLSELQGFDCLIILRPKFFG